MANGSARFYLPLHGYRRKAKNSRSEEVIVPLKLVQMYPLLSCEYQSDTALFPVCTSRQVYMQVYIYRDVRSAKGKRGAASRNSLPASAHITVDWGQRTSQDAQIPLHNPRLCYHTPLHLLLVSSSRIGISYNI